TQLFASGSDSCDLSKIGTKIRIEFGTNWNDYAVLSISSVCFSAGSRILYRQKSQAVFANFWNVFYNGGHWTFSVRSKLWIYFTFGCIGRNRIVCFSSRIIKSCLYGIERTAEFRSIGFSNRRKYRNSVGTTFSCVDCFAQWTALYFVVCRTGCFGSNHPFLYCQMVFQYTEKYR